MGIPALAPPGASMRPAAQIRATKTHRPRPEPRVAAHCRTTRKSGPAAPAEKRPTPRTVALRFRPAWDCPVLQIPKSCSVKTVDNSPFSVDNSPESVDNLLALCPQHPHLSTLIHNPQLLHIGCQHSVHTLPTSYPLNGSPINRCANDFVMIHLWCPRVASTKCYPPFPRPYYYFSS